MDKNKYIEVIDRYNRLWKENKINRDNAWWSMQAVIRCAMEDDTTTLYDCFYILEYRDRLFE